MPYISSIKMKNTAYDLRASVIGSADVGSTTKPVYLKAGAPVACGDSLGVSITGNAKTATAATTSGALSIKSTAAMSDETFQYYLKTGTDLGISNVSQNCYVMRMSKSGTAGYNQVEIAKSSDDNTYFGYRTVKNGADSAEWIKIVDSSNFEKIIGASYLKTSGGTMKGTINFGAESTGAYLTFDSTTNDSLTLRYQSGAVVLNTSDAELLSPGGSIKFNSNSATLSSQGVINITPGLVGNTDKKVILTGVLHLPYGSAIQGANRASSSTSFNIISISDGVSVYVGTKQIPLHLNGSLISTDGTSISTTSDANLKTNITAFDSRYDTFFDNLSPVTYQYINGNSGRLHSGLLAQDVEEALQQAGLTNQDFAAVTTNSINSRQTRIDEEGNQVDVEKSNTNYLLDQGITEEKSLRYGEFIGLLIDQVQKLKKEVNELKSQFK